MASTMMIACKGCGRNTFRHQSGLDAHLQYSEKCNQVAKDALAKFVSQQQEKIGEFAQEDQPKVPGIRGNENNIAQVPEYQEQDDFILFDDDDSSVSSDSSEPPEALTVIRPDDHDVSTKELDGFLEFIHQTDVDYFPFSEDEKAAVELLHLLRRKRATMDTYEAVMEWHYRASGELPPQQRLGDVPGYISRDKMFAMLYKRYMVNPAYNHDKTPRYYQVKTTVLPVSKAKVDIVYHDARDIIVSLLTDPRFSDDDYLHHDPDNPLAPPPEGGFPWYSDINTSKSYTKTYEKLITDPTKQMLVPIFMYIDGAITGQFDKMPVESLKMTHGLLTRKARDR